MLDQSTDLIEQMNSFTKWQALALEGKDRWREALSQSLGWCRQQTGDAVLSATFEPDVTTLAESLALGRPLAGIPFAAKDLFDVAGQITHCSSIMPDLLAAPVKVDAASVARMQELGALCCAKTQMNEFAYGLCGTNPHYGDCPHPFDQACLSGGSSSGSAYLVASGALPVALGTDTGGSIRVPAALCGLWGYRDQPGRWVAGSFPLAAEFDTVGWLTKERAEMIQMLRAWFDLPARAEPEPLRLASYMAEPFVCAEVAQTCHAYASALRADPKGADFSEFSEMMQVAHHAFNVLQSTEAYALHADRIERFGGHYDPAVKARLLRGREWSDKQRVEARVFQLRLQAWWDAFFQRYDALLLPAVPGPALPPALEPADHREQTLRLTAAVSLVGLPTLCAPLLLDSGKFIGVQIIFPKNRPELPLALLST